MMRYFKNTHPKSLPVFLLLLCAATAAFLAGIPGVPFHPDESTYIYTSSDTELFWQQPSALFWQPDRESDARQRYRELDAPLTNLFIFLGRRTAGEAALPVDWDWGKTWQENQQAGALPSPRLLLWSRLPGAILFPFSIIALFLITYRVSNEFTAWSSALLLASNALVLLHTRRAMAEGILLFASLVTLWSLLKAEKRPWLISIPAALAFSAKQTLAPLMAAGFLAVIWPGEKAGTKRWLTIIRQAVIYGALIGFLLFFLNPFTWGQPVKAVQAAIKARQALASAQVGDRPDQALASPTQKLVGMIAGLYMTPPQFAETGNYSAETKLSEQAYLANPLNSLFRSIAGGVILLVLNLFGFTIALLRAVGGKSARRSLWLLLAASTLQTLALLLLIPLPWQRYYLPLVPYTCLWTAFGMDQLRQMIMQAARVGNKVR